MPTKINELARRRRLMAQTKRVLEKVVNSEWGAVSDSRHMLADILTFEEQLENEREQEEMQERLRDKALKRTNQHLDPLDSSLGKV